MRRCEASLKLKGMWTHIHIQHEFIHTKDILYSYRYIESPEFPLAQTDPFWLKLLNPYKSNT